MSKARQHRQGPRRHAGAQGQAPSSQARLLASSPRMGALPAGTTFPDFVDIGGYIFVV